MQHMVSGSENFSLYDVLEMVLYACRQFYKILGVSKTATKQEIQAAYRGLAMRHHPDMVPDAEKAAAQEKFQNIQEAYSTLRDAKKRSQYDSS